MAEAHAAGSCEVLAAPPAAMLDALATANLVAIDVRPIAAPPAAAHHVPLPVAGLDPIAPSTGRVDVPPLPPAEHVAARAAQHTVGTRVAIQEVNAVVAAEDVVTPGAEKDLVGR